jgi:hypothetical protein
MGMGIFIQCGYGSHTGIAPTTLTDVLLLQRVVEIGSYLNDGSKN